MLHTIIQKNSYMDSVELMVLSKQLGKFDGVEKATVMMGTAANLDIMRKGGFGSDELSKAAPNDMVIAVITDDEKAVDAVVAAVKEAAKGKKDSGNKNGGMEVVKTWDAVSRLDESFNVCLISVPGEYAAEEAMTALEQGRNVMLFSDNVTEEDERKLKETAHEKGLLVMGPDCGTSVLSGVPLAFANTVRRGTIGVAGAAGTGIQEVIVGIDRLGGGISHAIGTGGRDLHEEIGGITMKDAIAMLENDPETTVITVVSKPPADSVKNELKKVLAGLTKPAAVLFLGEKGGEVAGNVHYAGTMQQLCEIAVALSGMTVKQDAVSTDIDVKFSAQPKLMGLFSGGTLASETCVLTKEAMGIVNPEPKDGYVLASENCDILDLGDDQYTKGKPHPMMDSNARKEKLIELVGGMDRPAVVLMDVVLGWGSSVDPSTELAEGMMEVKKLGKEVAFVVNLLGTRSDMQGIDAQRKILEDAGAVVFEGNSLAVEAALKLCGYAMPEAAPIVTVEAPEAVTMPAPADTLMELTRKAPGVVNIGLKGFASDLDAQRAQVVHYEWKPIAGGDRKLKRAIDFLNRYKFEDGRTIDEVNEDTLAKMTASLPFLVDIVPACEATDVFDGGKLLLHAGPPMTWDDMCHPIQGSCVGAALFEGWAQTEEEAWELLRSGEVKFMPCHHAGFVGPMGGITSPHMAVLKVLNKAGGNYAYCTMNEGIGQVLRFGAYGPSVVKRLHFMADTLGPVMSKALATTEGGLNLNVMVSRAIAMGDEFHQRNIAASLVFLKEMAPLVTALPDDQVSHEEKYSVIKFLADTDQFFLNIMMAAAKATMDYAATNDKGTVVTVMSRNGKDFGVRCAGMGTEWFTGPVNTPKGLYFAGFSEEDANPDMGDSAITETFGVGGMAMIAAPAVTRFVGSGGFYDALETSNRMCEITISHNGMFSIPTWDFKGTTLGIDIRKVAATGITPVINTGIAHKIAGKGQIGAGTVNPPLECFSKAVMAYAKKLGFEE